MSTTKIIPFRDENVYNKQVTVRIPASKEERLTSGQKRRGEKAGKGWWRHVVAVDRTKKGGFALLGGSNGPFLLEGEALFNVGDVIVEAHWNETARVTVVAYDGALISLRGKDGDIRYTDYKKSTQTLCGFIEDALIMTQTDLCKQNVDGLRILAAFKDEYAVKNPYLNQIDDAASTRNFLDRAIKRQDGLPFETCYVDTPIHTIEDKPRGIITSLASSTLADILADEFAGKFDAYRYEELYDERVALADCLAKIDAIISARYE